MKINYEQTALITNQKITELSASLLEYNRTLNELTLESKYIQEEQLINLPFDEQGISEVLKLKTRYCGPKLKYIIDIGIGGSNLGTKAIYDALYGYFDIVNPNRFPKIIFADTNDSAFIFQLKNFINTNIKDPEEILLNPISKSGNTTETIVNLDLLAVDMPFIKDRLVITTAENSNLWRIAQLMNIPRLTIPRKVPGRFSVFSGVGLFPLACAGVNLVELLRGAMHARVCSLRKDPLSNPAMVSACIIYNNYLFRKNIHDSFFFHPQLESLGKWYRQLIGESLGKEGKGITPTVSVGSTDLHSTAQLYLGGPKDKFFTFIHADNPQNKLVVPKDSFTDILDEIENKDTQQIMDAILLGVKKTFFSKEIPFMEIVLENISPTTLGEFMQMKMMETMFLGKLFKVNTFDQPDVEAYKIETRKILKNA